MGKLLSTTVTAVIAPQKKTQGALRKAAVSLVQTVLFCDRVRAAAGHDGPAHSRPQQLEGLYVHSGTAACCRGLH